jgi:hypothetical protein
VEEGVSAYYWIATILLFGAALFIKEFKKK